MNLSISKYVDHYKTKWKKKSRIYGESIEDWISDELTCRECEGALKKKPVNCKGIDHECSNCGETYQVKAQGKKFTFKDDAIKIMGAEYNTTLKTISKENPNFFLVNYEEKDNIIKEVLYIPRKHISKDVVIPRKKLSENARRAGWQGCYLRFLKDSTFSVNLTQIG